MGKDLKGKELGTGITQRKDGRYSAKFTLKNGKRVEKYFDKVSEAKEWMKLEKAKDLLLFTGSEMLVDDWYNYWIMNYKEGVVKDNTVKNYRQRYNSNIKSEIGSLKLCEVKNIHCQSILNKMERDNFSKGTIQLTNITLHALFKDAVKNDYIAKNPADGLILPRCEEDEEDREKRVLTKEEQKIFFEYSKHTMYHNAYQLVLETGLRVGEVGGLQWNDIDWERKSIKVQRTLLQKKGGFYFGSPKTKKSKREIPLTNRAIEILKEQKLLQSRLMARSKNWSLVWHGLIFTTINGNPVGASTFKEMINRIVYNINLDRKNSGEPYEEFEHLFMHSLRHTFATRSIENGIKPKVLQTIMGHSSITVTMDLYVHILDDEKFEEIKKNEITNKSGVVKVS